MYILFEWLTYKHISVELACVSIGGYLPRDTMQQNSVCCHPLLVSIHLLGAFTLSWPPLPVLYQDLLTPSLYLLPMKSSTSAVVEGIPPVTCHLIEKVRKWKYINLADLLKNHNSSDQLIVGNGQVLSVPDQKPWSSNRVVADIFTWLQVYNIFTAILLYDCQQRNHQRRSSRPGCPK